MATNFPGGLDTNTLLPNPSANSFTNNPDHAGLHTNINDAIKALEAKLGINSSADTSSIDYKIASLTSSLAGKANLSGSTLASTTLTAPTIADFSNAGHSHANASGGGKLAENALNLTDVSTGNVSAAQHGFAPKAPNDINQFLRGDGAWSNTPYIIPWGFGISSPVDATTYYGNYGLGSSQTELFGRIYVAVAGIITAVYINAVASGTVGTTEASTLAIRLNNTSDTVIDSGIVLDTGAHNYIHTGLSIPVSAGDFISPKLITPAWATNPGFIGLSVIIRVN